MVNGSTNFVEAVLHSAIDLANARASKILLTRTEIHAELDLDRFVSVYNSAWQFILWSEALVGRVVGSLRGVVVAQVSLPAAGIHHLSAEGFPIGAGFPR